LLAHSTGFILASNLAMSESFFFFHPEAQQAATAAGPVRFLLLALVASVSFIALWQIWSFKSAAAYWWGSHAVLAVLLAAYAYVTLVLLRKCSRIYYRSDRARKELHGYLCGWMPIIESVVNVFEFGPLTPWPFASYIVLLACSAIVLVQPMATFDWMRWLSSCLLVVCTYSITRVWAKAAQALMFYPYPHGAPQIPRIYLSTLGTIKILGDWECYESRKPGPPPRCFLSYRGIQKQRAIRVRDALIGAGIEVEMYDPINRWKDAPNEISLRIEKMQTVFCTSNCAQADPVITENLVCMPTPSAAGTDRGYLEAARQYNGVLIREAGCKKKSGVGPRGYCFGLQDDRKLQRRGPTISKRPDAGSGGEVLPPEESLRWARVPASPLLSTPERPWPAPDEFGSAGSRQNNFGEFDTTIVDSIRLHGPNIPGEWNRSAAPRTDFAMEIAVR
jgi:hypothetical protein